MAVALKLLPSIANQLPDGILSPNLGFMSSSAIQFGWDLRHLIPCNSHKFRGSTLKLVKAVRKVDETSSLKHINGQADRDFTCGCSDANGNGNYSSFHVFFQHMKILLMISEVNIPTIFQQS